MGSYGLVATWQTTHSNLGVFLTTRAHFRFIILVLNVYIHSQSMAGVHTSLKKPPDSALPAKCHFKVA